MNVLQYKSHKSHQRFDLHLLVVGREDGIAALSKYAGLVFLARIVFRLNQDWYGFNVIIYLYQETRHQYYTKSENIWQILRRLSDITVKEKRENEAEEN